MISEFFKNLLVELFLEYKRKLNLKTVPKLILKHNTENAKDIFGKTGYYDPETKTIVLYITNRLGKDVLRSYGHELIHFWQDENGKLNVNGYTGKNYAQEDKSLRNSEKQAYLLGSVIFRDFEDKKKNA